MMEDLQEDLLESCCAPLLLGGLLRVSRVVEYEAMFLLSYPRF